MTVDFTKERLFKACAYCGLTRLCNFYGRRWLCDSCAEEHLGETQCPMCKGDGTVALAENQKNEDNS